MQRYNDKVKIEKLKCTHIRIRDSNDYNLNVEDVIKSIEKEFHIDFRSLKEWKYLVKRLHVAQTDYKRKINDVKEQKAKIIEKLFIESSRPSPFELTDVFARTAEKWRRLKYRKKSSLYLPPDEEKDTKPVEEEVVNVEHDGLHFNTKNPSEIILHDVSKADVDIQHSLGSDKPFSTLPVFIYTNTHKLISPLGSKTDRLSYHSVPGQKEHEGENVTKEWQPSTDAIISNPKKINVVNNTLEEQYLTFSLTNCTSEYLHVRFKLVTNISPFKEVTVHPVIPKRLYPGIAVVYKLAFKLRSREDFKSGLYFRIGRDVTEPFFIPVLGKFNIKPLVTISETVTIPPAYPWHIKMGPEFENPRGTVTICTDGPTPYHLHIRKLVIDLLKKPATSLDVSPPDNTSLEERDSLVQSTFGDNNSRNPVNKDELAENNDMGHQIFEISITDAISYIVEDIVLLALDTFLFDRTYMFLQPDSKSTISVFFIEAEHIGYHQSYYNIELINPETETVVVNKTIKVYAETLPHPIQITPLLLDMTKSPLVHGYFEDHFIISNTHKVFEATIHIKLTTKMKKLFCVSPMKTTIQAQSSKSFSVNFCSRNHLSPLSSKYFVHFTFKIIVMGYKTVYKNVPPLFYEIIAPCEIEFLKVYPEIYFKETQDIQT